jgi:hypothetical protein
VREQNIEYKNEHEKRAQEANANNLQTLAYTDGPKEVRVREECAGCWQS